MTGRGGNDIVRAEQPIIWATLQKLLCKGYIKVMMT